MFQSSKGFTLIELLISISVIGVLITTGLNVGSYNNKNNLLQAANSISTFIRQGQEIAYKQENKQQLKFHVKNNVCYRVEESMIVDRFIIPEGIEINRTSFTSDNLFFNKKLAPGSGGTIYLHSKGHKLKITVIPVTGRVRIYPTTKGRWD